jgi:hypothetical protein
MFMTSAQRLKSIAGTPILIIRDSFAFDWQPIDQCNCSKKIGLVSPGKVTVLVMTPARRPVYIPESALLSFALSALGRDFYCHRGRYGPISGSAFYVSGFVASISDTIVELPAVLHQDQDPDHGACCGSDTRLPELAK